MHQSVNLLQTPRSLAVDSDGTAAVFVSEPASFDAIPGFNELVPCWNVRYSEGITAIIEVQAAPSPGTGGLEWSRWMEIGRVGASSSIAAGLADWSSQDRHLRMHVDIDTLGANRPLAFARCRVRALATPGLRGPASLVLEQLSLTATSPAPEIEQARCRVDERTGPAVVVHAVPFRSQHTPRSELAGRICSPTSVAMVLGAAGVDVAVQSVADAAYDQVHDIYGNWPRNVQAAFELGASRGVRRRFARFSTPEQAERWLAEHGPIVASIAVEPGELTGAPYPETDGHLVVITGYDRDRGKLMVNDPAARDAERGVLEYSMREFYPIWLGRCKGSCYLIEAVALPTESNAAPRAR